MYLTMPPPKALIALCLAFFIACATVDATVVTNEKGQKNTTSFRVFAKDKEDNRTISFWHDVPLRNSDGTYNVVVEIPKNTKAKFEVSTKEANNPIAQDLKKTSGQPTVRDYAMPIHWNYGMFPQTWEDPAHERPEIKGAGGDNDPLDVVEIGNATLPTGSVVAVKPLGILAMVDQGELDWKVIAINAADPKAKEVNDIEDVERVFPGELERIHAWLRDYKIPDGKQANKFGFGDKAQPKSLALEVIDETNGFWKDLITRKRANDQEKALA